MAGDLFSPRCQHRSCPPTHLRDNGIRYLSLKWMRESGLLCLLVVTLPSCQVLSYKSQVKAKAPHSQVAVAVEASSLALKATHSVGRCNRTRRCEARA
jgi:hypothetical protein